MFESAIEFLRTIYHGSGLYDLVHNQVLFPLSIELMSLLILAPLTAQFVTWRANARWQKIRSELTRELVIEFNYLYSALTTLIRGLPSKSRILTNAELAVIYFRREATTERHIWARSPDGLPILYRETDYWQSPVVEFPNVAEYLTRKRLFPTLALARASASRFESTMVRFGFCMSPEMIESVARCFQSSNPDVYRRILELDLHNQRREEAKGRIHRPLHLEYDYRFLPSVSEQLSDWAGLDHQIDYHFEKKHYVERMIDKSNPEEAELVLGSGRNYMASRLDEVALLDWPRMFSEMRRLVDASGAPRKLKKELREALKGDKVVTIEETRPDLAEFGAVLREWNEIVEAHRGWERELFAFLKEAGIREVPLSSIPAQH